MKAVKEWFDAYCSITIREKDKARVTVINTERHIDRNDGKRSTCAELRNDIANTGSVNIKQSRQFKVTERVQTASGFESHRIPPKSVENSGRTMLINSLDNVTLYRLND